MAGEEYGLLVAIQKGKTLGQAIDATFSKHSKTFAADLEQVTAWFQNWSNLGWFCAPPAKSAKAQKIRERSSAKK
jgi:hypothetical protein